MGFKISKKCLVASIALCSLSVSAHASDDVSLTELLDASKNHPSVRLSENALRVSGYNLDTAKWSKYPSFSVDGIAPIDSDDTLTLKLEQPLWTAGRSDALIDAAKAELSAAEIKIQESIDLIQGEVISAYIDLWRAQEKLIAADDNVGELKGLASVIERRVVQQVSPESELALVNARLSQALADQSQHLGMVRQAVSRLQQASGLKVEHAKTLTCQLPSDLTLDRIKQLALSQSSTLKRLEIDKSASQFDYAAAEAERWPKLVVGVQSVTQQGGLDSTDNKAYFGFQYQLTDGFSVNSRMSAAESEIQNYQYQYDEAKIRLVQSIDNFYTGYELSNNQIPSLENLARVNADLIDSYRRQYNVGKKSWLDVVNAQREVAQAKVSLIDAQANTCLNALQIEQATRLNFVR